MKREDVRGADGVRLRVWRAGTGPAVVLLHGFPENHHAWRHQVEPLRAAGFTVLAPDLRGYGESDVPEGVEAYAPDRLVGDVAAIVRASGAERAHIVGHDWGGIIAWWFAAAHPELVDRLVIMNSPHPSIFRRKVRRPPQLLRSWYAGFFQLPALPEVALHAFDCAVLRRLFRTTPARRDTFSDADIEEYIAPLRERRRITAALNYYRAALRYGVRAPRGVRTDATTLIVWGEQDVALTTGLLDGVERYAPRARVVRIGDAGHWVQNEARRRVTEEVVGFLRGGAGTA